jgi:hypothetical protein
MKNRKIRKPAPKIPIPKNGAELIVLTGLVHEETGRQFVFCTKKSAGQGFFLAREDMVSPDGDKDLAARCEHCMTEGDEPETHWIVNFKTALYEEMVDTGNDGYIVTPALLIRNLMEHGSGLSPAKRAAS